MASETRDLAPAVTRAVRILDALARAAEPVKPAFLAADLGVPKSSLHGVCSSLVSQGVIERTKDGHYMLGLRVVDWGSARVARSNLAQDFVRAWVAYPEFAAEAALLSELDGTHVIYLACRNSAHPLGVTFRTGMRLPAASTATGKALLAALSEEEIDRRFGADVQFPRFTGRSVKSLRALKTQLRVVRDLGYSIDDGETREGMYSIGKVVLERSGETSIAGIALCFFRGSLPMRKERQAVAALCEVAEQLSQRAVRLR